MWKGTWRSIPQWFCNLFKVLGIGLVSLSGVFALTGLWQAVPGPLFAGCIHSALGFLILERFRNRMDSLVTQEQVAAQLGVSLDTVKKAVEDKTIKPEYILNDEPVYALHAFGDAGILLRSSSPPAAPDSNLLRAAAGTPNQTRPDTLLRPSGNSEQVRERHDYTAPAEPEAVSLENSATTL